jgi:small subunit ribosomal protein S6
VKALRTYEALYIVRPDLKDDEIQTVAQEVESLITGNGGAIVRSEHWGKRKLAYLVKKHTEGYYVLLRFQAPEALPSRLANHFRLSENVIRDLIVYFDDKTLKLEEEQRVRNEAAARASHGRERERDDDDDDGGRRGRHGDDDDDDGGGRRRRHRDDDDDSA